MDNHQIEFLSLKSVTSLYADEIHEAVRRVVDSGWYLQGAENEAFEREYADYIGTKFAVGCANGLDALIWIIRAYKELGHFRDGDEILVPANTYIATILAITENNLKAVLVEPRLDTLEIDDEKLEEALTPRTKAVMIVHLYGRCAYTEKIGAFCKAHGLKLFEDNAQAHGCRYVDAKSVRVPVDAVAHRVEKDGETSSSDAESLRVYGRGRGPASTGRTGALGDAAAHSFYPGKNLGALGDAGAVTTNDPEVADCIRSLGNYGSSKKYVFQYCGRNSRLDEIQAAVLRVKLRHLEENVARRRAVAEMYYAGLGRRGRLPYVGAASCRTNDGTIHSSTSTSHFNLMLPLHLPQEANAYHLFPILCTKRDELQAHLKANGIQTLIHYPIPPHEQACYAQAIKDGLLVLPKGGLSVTERIHAEELSLPIGPTITDDEVKTVIESISSFAWG